MVVSISHSVFEKTPALFFGLYWQHPGSQQASLAFSAKTVTL